MNSQENASPTHQSRGGSRRRLRSIRNVRALVADTLRDVEQHGDPGDSDRARVIIYGAKVLAELIEASDLEGRIKALEADLADVRQQRERREQGR